MNQTWFPDCCVIICISQRLFSIIPTISKHVIIKEHNHVLGYNYVPLDANISDKIVHSSLIYA